MALVIDETVGGANSNAYDNLANAAIYFEGRLNKAAWSGASTEDQNASLVHATTALDAELYDGEKTSVNQRLKWPRINVEDDDGIIIAGTVIPKEMKEAMFEMALVLLGNDIQAHTGLEKFELLKVGDIEIEPRDGVANVLPDEVQKLIARFQTTGTSSKRVRG